MRDFISSGVLLTCLTAICVTVTFAAPNDRGEAIVRKLSDQETAAFLHRDAAALSGIWSEDLVVTNPLNILVTRRQILEMVRSGFLVITSFSRNIEYAKSYQDIVILVGTEEVVWGGNMPNAGKSEKLRFTAVWRNENGTWREVARHANIVETVTP